MKALVLAAGLGTRLKPITDTIPKALVEIKGKTLLEITLNKLLMAGFDEIIVNVHHFADQIISYLATSKKFANVVVSDESNLLLDTGGGIKKAGWFFDGGQPFLVHNVDILTDFDLIKLYKHHRNSCAVATLAVQERESSRYFLFDDSKTLCGWKNEKTGETKNIRAPIGSITKKAFSGIHILSPVILKMMPNNDVFSVVDLYLSIAKENRITFFDHTGSTFLDLGKTDSLQKAASILIE